MVSKIESKGEVVVDLEKEKGEKVHDQTLAMGRPDSPRRVRSIIGDGAALAESKVEGLDTGSGPTGAFGHLLNDGEFT